MSLYDVALSSLELIKYVPPVHKSNSLFEKIGVEKLECFAQNPDVNSTEHLQILIREDTGNQILQCICIEVTNSPKERHIVQFCGFEQCLKNTLCNAFLTNLTVKSLHIQTTENAIAILHTLKKESFKIKATSIYTLCVL